MLIKLLLSQGILCLSSTMIFAQGSPGPVYYVVPTTQAVCQMVPAPCTPGILLVGANLRPGTLVEFNFEYQEVATGINKDITLYGVAGRDGLAFAWQNFGVDFQVVSSSALMYSLAGRVPAFQNP